MKISEVYPRWSLRSWLKKEVAAPRSGNKEFEVIEFDPAKKYIIVFDPTRVDADQDSMVDLRSLPNVQLITALRRP